MGSSLTMLNASAYMYVGIDAMEGFSGRVDCPFGEKGSWLFPSKDELDIVGEVIIVEKKSMLEVLHLQYYCTPLLSVMGSKDWTG